MTLRTTSLQAQQHNVHPHQEERGRSKSKDLTRSAEGSQNRLNNLKTIQESSNSSINNKRTFRSKSTNDSLAMANRKRQLPLHAGRNHSEQLLYTAINQNHQFKSKLTKSMSSQGNASQLLPPTAIQKNIPMVHQEISYNKRPEFKRWNSYDIPSTNSRDLKLDVFSRPEILGKDSVSPLTVLQDNFNTKRPIVNNVVTMPTDNSFKSLSKENINEPDDSITTEMIKKPNLYEKMKNFANASMGSLVSFQDKVTNRSSDISRIQSELDDDDSNTDDDDDDDDEIWGNTNKENVPESDTQYPIDQVESNLSTQEQEEPINFEDLVKKIDDFQGNFVNKQSSRSGTLRSQQRQLDYKELYDYDSNDNSRTTFSYEWKIQNETISSQYNTIRLRFSSRHMGVLGFIERYQEHNKSSTPSTYSCFDDINSKLNDAWEHEYNLLFESSVLTTPVIANTESREDQNIYKPGTTNMAALAKSVKLGGV